MGDRRFPQKITRPREPRVVDASISERELTAGDDPVVQPRPGVAEVFSQHAPYVGRSLRLLGVPEREVPDAMQEVFLVVHQRLDELERPGALRSWLYAICVRKALHRRRALARRREEPVATVPIEGAAPSPHTALEQSRALDAAVQMLNALDDDQRAVFVLYEVEQMPMREVAEAVGCPMQTAYARLYAARRAIQRHLARMRARGEAPR